MLPQKLTYSCRRMGLVHQSPCLHDIWPCLRRHIEHVLDQSRDGGRVSRHVRDSVVAIQDLQFRLTIERWLQISDSIQETTECLKKCHSSRNKLVPKPSSNCSFSVHHYVHYSYTNICNLWQWVCIMGAIVNSLNIQQSRKSSPKVHCPWHIWKPVIMEFTYHPSRCKFQRNPSNSTIWCSRTLTQISTFSLISSFWYKSHIW